MNLTAKHTWSHDASKIIFSVTIFIHSLSIQQVTYIWLLYLCNRFMLNIIGITLLKTLMVSNP